MKQEGEEEQKEEDEKRNGTFQGTVVSNMVATSDMKLMSP